MALIFVQHLDPIHKSMMVDLLTGHTRMKVQEAVNGAVIEPENVYVIAAGTFLAVDAGKLMVTEPNERHGARLPFDFLLRSLAISMGDRAIGVVLSGNGADGVAGLRAIKSAGGLAVAQSPEEAEHDGMPLSAIRAGVADIILPIAKIPMAAIAFAAAAKNSGDADPEPLLGPIIELLRERLSHDFSGYKPGTLTRRVKRRMAVHGITDSATYLELLSGHGPETGALAKDLLIHVTSFFRDAEVFEHLALKIIPNVVSDHPVGHPLRVWVPACSSGEEAYSIAMLFLEEIEASKKRIQLQVFGSDIDDQAVATARAGSYPATLKDELSPARLARFFVEHESGYRVGPVLREIALFTEQNILSDPPFARLDVVSCRNLLIYLLPDAQQRVLGLLHFALRKDGVLVLGASENVGDLRQGFEPLAPDLRIFRRTGGNRKFSLQLGADGLPRAQRALAERSKAPLDLDVGEAARRLLMETYAPASVLVNERNEGVFHFGPTERYLQVPKGDATTGLLAMTAPGLRNKLRNALRDARAGNDLVSVSGGAMKQGQAASEVRIDVRPLPGGGRDLLLVSFSDAPRAPAAGPSSPKAPHDASRTAQLEATLEALQKELDLTTHELEASSSEQEAINEEARSLNEEYQSTNEELETSKEELQSLNEELTALNSQLSATVNQQRCTADDLDNILRSADLAIAFLDPNLKIRFLSSAAKALFGAIDSDIGRPIENLARRFDDPDFAADIRAVLDKREPVLRQIRAHSGEWYDRRVSPYRTQGGVLQGVVLTLTDISASKAIETKLAVERAYISSVTDTVRQALVVLDEHLNIVSANKSFCRTFNVPPEAVAEPGMLGIADGLLDTTAINAFLDRALAESAAIENYEVEIKGVAGARMVLLLSARPLPGDSVSGRRILVAIDDVTDRKVVNESLKAAKSKAEKANLGKSRFLAAASHDLRQPLQTLSLLHGVLARKVTEPEAAGLIGKLDETLGAMVGILDTLLDINQLEAGTVQPEINVIPVGAIINQLKSEVGYLARAKGLALRAVGSDLYVRSDQLLLAQMLRNLLSNAVKYTKHGKVLIGCRRRGDKVRLEVRDTGIGIPANQLRAIFDEYHQLANPARERGLGLGLGLSIVQRLADLLGHKIGVQSTPGKGSVFFVDVPLAKTPRKETAAAPSNHASAARRGDSVLIVEDDPMVSDALEMLFRNEGYRTTVAADGVQVTELLKNDPAFAPDIVIADYNLPGPANGLEVIASLRQAAGRQIPAVVLTGDIATHVLRRVMAADCNFFHKPVNVDQLVRRVDDILASSPAAAAPMDDGKSAQAPDGVSVIHIVDDDPALLASLSTMLTGRGYHVETYPSAEAFLAAAPVRRGCLVVDSVMPGMTGLELLKRLKADNCSLPTIVITGYGDINMAIKAMNAGAMDFMEKPAREDVLIASIDRALAQAEESEQPSESQAAARALIAALTKREREVMHLVVAGLPNNKIAASLGISQRTIENHRAAVMKRTHSASLADLIRLVMQAA